MTHARSQVQPQQDPGLVELFKGSKRSYDEDVDDLIARLDESAAYTRAQRKLVPSQRSAAPQKIALPGTGKAVVVRKVLPIREGTPPKKATDLAGGKKSSPTRGKANSKAR